MKLPDDLTSTLKEGRQAYVAVPSKQGPHVTPELYAWSDGRLWFAAAAGTVKSNVLKREGDWETTLARPATATAVPWSPPAAGA